MAGNNLDDLPGPFRRGDPLNDGDLLNRVLRSLASRITSDGSLEIAATAEGISISLAPQELLRAAPDRVLAKITEEIGGGSYKWARLKGNGPASGDETDPARELSDTTGLAVDTVIALDRAENNWWFSGAAATDFAGCQLHMNGNQTVGSGSGADLVWAAQATPNILYYDEGGMFPGSDTSHIKILEDGKYNVALKLRSSKGASTGNYLNVGLNVLRGGGSTGLGFNGVNGNPPSFSGGDALLKVQYNLLKDDEISVHISNGGAVDATIHGGAGDTVITVSKA